MLPPNSLRTYVIVRGDIPKSHQAVQAGHALAELAFNAGKRKDNYFETWVKQDRTLILLRAKNMVDLMDYHDKIEEAGLVHNLFYEPDMNGEPTALAIYPGTAGDLDPHFRLLGLV